MSEFRDKLLSIAAPRRMGQTEKVTVLREDGPGVAGYHIKHWDGRQDAIATPGTLRVKPQVREARAEGDA